MTKKMKLELYVAKYPDGEFVIYPDRNLFLIGPSKQLVALELHRLCIEFPDEKKELRTARIVKMREVSE